MENREEFNKLYNYIKNKNILNIISNHELNKEEFKNLTEEDKIVCLYLVAIDKEDLNALIELNNKYLNLKDKVKNISNKNLPFFLYVLNYIKVVNDTQNFNIIDQIYKRELLDQNRIQKIISLENFFNFEVNVDLIISIIKMDDGKLLRTLYNNFIYNNSFIKELLYCYRNSKNNKSTYFLSNSMLNQMITKETSKIDLNQLNSNRRFTPLIYACAEGKEKAVAFLMENGVDLNKGNKKKETPLIYACKEGHKNIVKLLIKNGADINKRDAYGNSPLIYACQKGNENIVQYLIEKGAELNVKNKYDITPLIIACKKGYESIVNLLIQHGVDVNKEDEEKYTP